MSQFLSYSSGAQRNIQHIALKFNISIPKEKNDPIKKFLTDAKKIKFIFSCLKIKPQQNPPPPHPVRSFFMRKDKIERGSLFHYQNDRSYSMILKFPKTLNRRPKFTHWRISNQFEEMNIETHVDIDSGKIFEVYVREERAAFETYQNSLSKTEELEPVRVKLEKNLPVKHTPIPPAFEPNLIKKRKVAADLTMRDSNVEKKEVPVSNQEEIDDICKELVLKEAQILTNYRYKFFFDFSLPL